MENLDLYQYPWYYGKINRQEAEENLIDRGENEGCFLVRESQSRAGQWTISVLDWIEGRCNVGHYLISQDEEGRFNFEKETTFSSIAELVKHYQEHPESVSFVLKDPCPREIRLPDKDANDYDLYEIATELPIGEEFFREKLLSNGTISDTWKGYLKSFKTVKVIAKIAKDHEDSLHTLTHEANALKWINHENIVKFRGVLSSTPQFHLIQDWAGDMNLIGFLLNNSGPELSLIDQLNIGIQIASGLEFCGKMKCVHRNVKAKSVIINGADLKCKLGAFKNSRTVGEHGYYHALTTEDKLAATHNSRIRWMAIEAARDGRYSFASDAWSFAVVMVEIFSRGGLPYAGYLTCKVLAEVEAGFRCPKPQDCPPKIYEMMHHCWMPSEKERLHFSDIKTTLMKYLQDNREVLAKLSPAKTQQWNRYAPWKPGSVKQQKTTRRPRGPAQLRSPTSPLPPIPVAQYGYDN